MTETRTVQLNRNLKALLDKHPDVRDQIKQEKNSQIRRLLNVWANVYARDPEAAIAAADHMRHDYEQNRAFHAPAREDAAAST